MMYTISHAYVQNDMLLKIEIIKVRASCMLILAGFSSSAKLISFVYDLVQVWTEREGVRNLLNLIGKEVKMQGYMATSYLDRFGDFAKEMESHLKQGKIGSKIKIVHGIENFLESLGSLFTSSNIGKVVIQVK